MSVILETSKGDIIVDLYVDQCPNTSKNFLKLCKAKYYNNVLFHNVQKNFIVQTGDPTGTGKGGDSIFKLLYGEQARFFDPEIREDLKHKKKGLLCMAGVGEDHQHASQFFFTMGEELLSLDEKHTVFGEIAEGMDCLERINEAYCDDDGRPYQNMRIRHTVILDDPFDDPPGLEDLPGLREGSPEFVRDPNDTRLEDDWVPEEDQRSAEEIEESLRQKEAKERAVVLEMIGDLPEADVEPPDTHLFVCKLNPVTQDEVRSRRGTGCRVFGCSLFGFSQRGTATVENHPAI